MRRVLRRRPSVATASKKRKPHVLPPRKIATARLPTKTVENSKRTLRPVLGDKTNDRVLPSESKITLRQRHKKVYMIDSTDSGSSPTTPFKRGVICSPRPSSSRKPSYSTQKFGNFNTCLKDSFVLLENIDEVVSSQGSNAGVKKVCVYKAEDPSESATVLTQDMLPEDKLKLYEFEVDVNEPKQVKKKKKRVRKPRKKKIEISDTSDEENISIKSVVKQLCDLSTASPTTKKQTSSCIGSTFLPPMLKKSNNKENFCIPNKTGVTSRPMRGAILSPILSENCRSIHTPATVRFTVENIATASSTPQTPPPTRRRMALTPKAFCNFGASLGKNSNAYKRVMPSIFVAPTMNVEHNFSLELNENDSNVAIEPASPQNVINNIQTLPKVDENPPSPEGQILRQSKINSFFGPSVKSCDRPNVVDSISLRSDLNGTGLFDETPSCSKSSTKEFNSSVNSYVTVRKRFIESLLPRVSSLEPRESDTESDKPLTIDNCFGFDDDGSSDEILSSPLPARYQPKLKPVAMSSSTPYVRPAAAAPVRFTTRELKRVLAPLVAKKPVVPAPSKPVVPLISETRAQLPVTPARRSYERPARLKRSYVSDDEDQQSGGEDQQVVLTKRPKKKPRDYKKKEMKQVASWVASMNAEFNEIEDMELCVE